MLKFRNFALALLLLSVALGIAHGALYEEKCSDGTGYFQCSSASPGYACLPDNDTLSLQNVIGSNSSLEKKCNCTNYAGFVLQNGACVNASALKKAAPPAAKGGSPSPSSASGNGTGPSGAQASAGNSYSSQSAQAASQNATGSIPAELLKYDSSAKAPEGPPSQIGFFEIVLIVGAVSVVGGVALLICLLVAGYFLFGNKKEGM